MARHHVIYIPGLADKFNRSFGQGVLFSFWRFSSVRPHYFLVGWTNSDETYEHKMKRLLKLIDHLHAKGHIVSLVSSSAGASLAVVAFQKRTEIINALVCIVPKLRNPQTVPETFFLANPAFRNALHALEIARPKLSKADRQKMLIIKPLADAVVPLADMDLTHAHVRRLNVRGHLLTIVLALTWFKKISITFIKTRAAQK